MASWLRYAFAVSAVVMVAGPAASRVTDFGVPGRKLLIRSIPGHHKLVFKSKGLVVTTPTIETPGDPRCTDVGGSGGGGAIRVNGGGGNEFTIPLPCEGWTVGESGEFDDIEYAADYRYRDRTGATCERVDMLHAQSLRALCRGPQVVYTLDAPQGDIDVTIRTGAVTERVCARFGPPPTRVVKDGSRGTYLAIGAPEPHTPPCASSPSGAFLDASR